MVKTRGTFYLINFGNELGYIYGGTFRLRGEKYAKLTQLHSEAKRYSSKKRAIEAGKRYAQECQNICKHFFVEDEDGFHSWRY